MDDAEVPTAARSFIDLSGQWMAANAEKGIRVACDLPGDVHSALIAAGTIPHPYAGLNELKVRWVAESTWIVTRDFHVDDLMGGTYYLDISGLDTVATVRLNGVEVLQSDNCFRRYRPIVTGQLRSGANTIEIEFHSNLAEADRRQAEQPFPIPYAAQNCPLPNGNMLRKPACHFGWDWNLAIAPFGLYGQIALRRMNQLRIEHVTVRQKHGDGQVAVDVDVTLYGKGETEIAISLGEETKRRRVKASFGEAVQRFRFTVSDPVLWWPAGLGAQHLYDLRVTCEGQTEFRRIGLRTIELLADPDEAGRRFCFRVNGQEMFCRGANWIPADALPSAATPELTGKLLRAAADANMNMIRVWGGGFYEQDCFYDLCDELGLLVWQDFMFACNLYPSTPDFLAEVRAEVAYQVRRLQHHACLALWCGDNELIGALTWFKESKDNRDRYLVNYDRLNRTIEEAMKAADPAGTWWPSSPSPGVLDFGDAWHRDSAGDMHFWSVWHEGRNFEHYHDVRPRFCSEFGFQSFPSLGVAKSFCESAEDLNIASPVMEHHQRNTGGNARIAETMFRTFRFPMDFGNFVYLSQIQQGLAMRMAVEYWRSLKPHCMGTLYWQLNDTWPVASWSGLDHGGGWKALHYMARRFYAPVFVAVRREAATGDIVFTAVNDTREAQSFDMALRFAAADGGLEPPAVVAIDDLGPEAREVHRIAAAAVRTDGVYIYAWETENGAKERNHFAAAPYKAIRFADPELDIGTRTEAGRILIRLKAARLALFACAETDIAGHFDDNAFDLLPGEARTIAFTPDHPGELERVLDTLAIRHLHGATH